MRGLTFEVSGPFAHFRKFYGTNTAMSYFLPPRTTLMGLLAARMGLAKESYHELLHSENLRIGVASTGPMRKQFHRVNNLKIKGPADFRGQQGRQQTPLELVSAAGTSRTDLSYRIFLSPGQDASAFDAVRRALLEPPPGAFAPCLGAAFCVAFLHSVREVDFGEVPGGTELQLRSAVNADWVMRFGKFVGLYLEEETLPLDFAARVRKPTAIVRTFYPTGSENLRVVLNRSAYRDVDGSTFTFLEA